MWHVFEVFLDNYFLTLRVWLAMMLHRVDWSSFRWCWLLNEYLRALFDSKLLVRCWRGRSNRIGLSGVSYDVAGRLLARRSRIIICGKDCCANYLRNFGRRRWLRLKLRLLILALIRQWSLLTTGLRNCQNMWLLVLGATQGSFWIRLRYLRSCISSFRLRRLRTLSAGPKRVEDALMQRFESLLMNLLQVNIENSFRVDQLSWVEDLLFGHVFRLTLFILHKEGLWVLRIFYQVLLLLVIVLDFHRTVRIHRRIVSKMIPIDPWHSQVTKISRKRLLFQLEALPMITTIVTLLICENDLIFAILLRQLLLALSYNRSLFYWRVSLPISHFLTTISAHLIIQELGMLRRSLRCPISLRHKGLVLSAVVKGTLLYAFRLLIMLRLRLLGIWYDANDLKRLIHYDLDVFVLISWRSTPLAHILILKVSNLAHFAHDLLLKRHYFIANLFLYVLPILNFAYFLLVAVRDDSWEWYWIRVGKLSAVLWIIVKVIECSLIEWATNTRLRSLDSSEWVLLMPRAKLVRSIDC